MSEKVGRLIYQPRGIWKTTMLCEGLRDKNCIYVVRNNQEVKRLKKLYPNLKIMGLNSDFTGINVPIYIDPDALILLIHNREQALLDRVISRLKELLPLAKKTDKGAKPYTVLKW